MGYFCNGCLLNTRRQLDIWRGCSNSHRVFWETFVYGGSQLFPGNSKTTVVSLLNFCRLLLLPKFLHQYVWWSVFKKLQEGMDFKQLPQASLSETLAGLQVKNHVGDTLSQSVWDCVEKKQSESIVCANCMKQTQRGEITFKKRIIGVQILMCVVCYHFLCLMFTRGSCFSECLWTSKKCLDNTQCFLSWSIFDLLEKVFWLDSVITNKEIVYRFSLPFEFQNKHL